MTLKYKVSLTVLLAIGGIVFGFIYLIRGCLSKYDELSALPRILYFRRDNQSVVVSLVKFEKATSYSRSGGFVRKSVSTSYYIQANDAMTGIKIKDRKAKHHSDIKSYPVEIMGASKNAAWVYLGEPMAFDPFTLETVADISVLEKKNPALKGKFPGERRFYEFNISDQNIYFTATDGSTWMLNTESLLASPSDEDVKETLADAESKRIEKKLKEIETAHDSLMEQKLRRPARMYAAKQINLPTYQKMMAGFNDEQTRLYKQRDSLRSLMHAAENISSKMEDIRKRVLSLNERTNIHFSQLKVNGDTVNGRWYGLYSKKEWEDASDHFDYQSLYNETARRKFYTSEYTFNSSGYPIIKKAHVLNNESDFFLDGGFLLDKRTGLPLKLDIDRQFLVIFKDRIGSEGNIQLARVFQGNTIWKLDTQLRGWADYLYTGGQLFIVGTDDKDLSTDECNVLKCVDLNTGKAAIYHFEK
jgi:hypothetical protein